MPASLLDDLLASGRLEAGRAAFNRGDYFHAHELWETLWLQLDGAERTGVQGLIQLAAGLHHLRHRRARPAIGLLEKGLAKLEGLAKLGPVAAHSPTSALARAITRLLDDLKSPTLPAPPPLIL